MYLDGGGFDSTEYSGSTTTALFGLVYLIGGSCGRKGSDQTLIYDTGSDSWTPGAALNKGRSNHSCTAVGCTLFLVGGAHGDDERMAGAALMTLPRLNNLRLNNLRVIERAMWMQRHSLCRGTGYGYRDLERATTDADCQAQSRCICHW